MVVYREIKLDEPEARMCADLIQQHSWGAGYPVDVWSELRFAEYLVGAFEDSALVGCASITRVASPDGVDNGKLWFADAVVLPGYRRRGIYRTLYRMRMEQLPARHEPLFTCTDSAIVEKFLMERGWHFYRSTKDESGGKCKVFRKEV